MRIFFCCLLAAAAAGFTARADDCDPPETAQRIIEREKQFLEMGLAQGTRAAFLEFLAEDAIAFEPGPANARQIWKARPEDTISSKWEPLFVGVSRGCDLAFTSGPSEWRKQSTDEKPFGYGQYVTIWKKQNDGAWKIVLDLGSQVPGARKSEEAPTLVVDPGEPNPDNPALAAKKLRQAEKWFSDTAATDSTGALIGASSPQILVHRGGVFPASGRDAAQLMLSVRRGALKTERLGSVMSAAHDFAYSYGRYTLDRGQSTERGYYLQIWRTDSKGAWKLVLDHQTPLSPEARPPGS